ncbi:MAG: ShlB/FhaC/HecB family hemolysin secretion/activation protein [Spirulina sp. SIO3F2]|nr:ShlB/FhaC/HecB family hemolysin secretion/activation protein [Spirulina sp. SIO3F2]
MGSLLTVPFITVAAWCQVPNTPNTNFDPRDLFPEQPEQPWPNAPEIPEQQLQVPALPPVVPQSQPSTLQQVVVDRFEVRGNTALRRNDLDEKLKKFYGQSLSIVELQQAAILVTQLYVEKGFITSGAFVPANQEQYSSENRTIVLQAIEGRAKVKVQVQGGNLEAGYVESRLNLATTTPFNVETIETALKQLQLDLNIDVIQAELAEAPETGLSILNVIVTPSDRFSASTFTNNNRSPSVGSEGVGTGLNIQNASGWGDSLSISPSFTDGSNSLNFSYTLPVSPHNTTVYANGGIGHSTIIEEPFDRLDIQSSSRYFNLGLRHPLKQTPTETIALSLELSHSRSQTTLLDIPFPLSPGADLQGRTRVSAIRLGQDWTTQGEDFLFAVRSRFSLGLDLFEATINETSPDSHFFSWQGQAQWVKLLGKETKLIVRGEAQLSDRPLLSGEQFGLGGQNTIRGYRQNALLTDNGLLGSAELYLPVLKIGAEAWLVELIPFFNIGTGWNSGESDQPETQTLISIGSGLRLSLSDVFSARLDWGIPLVNLSDTNETWQENGLYFQLLYSPF